MKRSHVMNSVKMMRETERKRFFPTVARMLHGACGMWVCANGRYFVFRTPWADDPFICVQNWGGKVAASQFDCFEKLMKDTNEHDWWEQDNTQIADISTADMRDVFSQDATVCEQGDYVCVYWDQWPSLRFIGASEKEASKNAESILADMHEALDE
ncbi:hypothetical protein B9G54_04425 [Alloscardovia macacae]|uniref:Uncharacterized protein n=1 Tax=Alloscardovia macacae TaxID=1160091 RepID=A0A1Y2SZY4_9BIFI|nr:hypothetical protein [Alloscardovia macacae]OTA26441.1 hypothetical protein B9G54_04425 [Alloscardovia macacae]OTA29879.1 hypothetical protein B9T39_02020 [Alloscardovia macacae]